MNNFHDESLGIEVLEGINAPLIGTLLGAVGSLLRGVAYPTRPLESPAIPRWSMR